MYHVRVSPVNQRLRAGFPPKELKPGNDPNLPVQLANGERVQVDVINPNASLISAQKDAEKGMYGVGERKMGEREEEVVRGSGRKRKREGGEGENSMYMCT